MKTIINNVKFYKKFQQNSKNPSIFSVLDVLVRQTSHDYCRRYLLKALDPIYYLSLKKDTA
jgi:hypothetical protein